MQRDEAIASIQTFLASLDIQSIGLSDDNVGEAEWEDMQFYFEYIEDTQKLHCSVFLYRFDKEPLPKVLEAVEIEEGAEYTPTGGGYVEYQKDNQCLLLTRQFGKVEADDTFAKILHKMVEAGRYWQDEGFRRVSKRAFAA